MKKNCWELFKNVTVKSSTLIEVLIAQVILMLVFFGFMTIYIKITHSNYGKLYMVQQEVSALASKLKAENDFGNRSYQRDNGLIIIEYSEPYKNSTSLLYLKLEAMVNQKTLTVHEEIISITAD